MNIKVLTTSSRKAGGLFYSVRWLSKALANEGCRPEILSPLDEFSQEDLGVWNPIPVELFRGHGPLQTSFRLREKLAASGADLIHLHGIWMDNQWAAAQWQARTGRPVVVSPRGMLDPWAVSNSAWKKRLVEILFAKKALRKASCIHALCRSEVESIRAYGLDNPVALIPNGVELPELGLREPSGTRKTLLFLGRIHPKKGITELLKAWSGFSGGWKLVIAGWDDGGYDEGLKALACELGLRHVEFVGPQYGKEKEQLLRSVDAFILPSFSEGLPMSVLEAWSYGLPVVVTDYCNLPEGFKAKAALRIAPDAETIANGLETLASMSGSELHAMGACGRKLVEDKFTWPRIAADMRQVYEWCVGGGNPPECMEFADG
ncbi:D-inositol 3-phosphate glycosyltransferase [Pontiella desulfatans]|uniref:D-inositol 3-phosphate glycosyltransferase n=1 Tax=Pontiella desulfatans TaxID=2750659 RepID=A0A6C2U450_PONDE|nr:glycosyltransferase [Pontiella desulfatans]VGO14812.1 D-inositol 3-phosphate glycosyltransferase [Pontiella desulfatans]